MFLLQPNIWFQSHKRGPEQQIQNFLFFLLRFLGLSSSLFESQGEVLDENATCSEKDDNATEDKPEGNINHLDPMQKWFI